MFGLGFSEILVLGVLALILIGPKQLPEVARTLGRLINELKRSAETITEDIKKQAKVDLDLDLGGDLLKPRKMDRDPDLPLKIMDDPRAKNLVSKEPKPEIVLQAPDQTTFPFDPVKLGQIASNEPIPPVAEITIKDGEKKD